METGELTAECFSVRVSTLYDALLEDYAVQGQRASDLPKRWLHLEPVFGRDHAREVTTPRIRQYVIKRQAENAAPATIERELACLRRMFKIGLADGRVAKVPQFPPITVNNTRTGFVDDETFEKLRSHLPEPIATMALLAYELGWRKEELMGLHWRQVDLRTKTVRLDPGTTKNGDGRVATLPPASLEALTSLREATSAFERENGRIVPHVFHRDGKPVKSFRGPWESACKEAGCPELLFHDLRRCAVRNYVRAGVPESVAMTITGHRTRDVFERYNITAESDREEAAAALAAFRSGAKLGQAAVSADLPPANKQAN